MKSRGNSPRPSFEVAASIPLPTTPERPSTPTSRPTTPSFIRSPPNSARQYRPTLLSSPTPTTHSQLGSPEIQQARRGHAPVPISLSVPGLITLTTPTPKKSSFDFGEDDVELHEVDIEFEDPLSASVDNSPFSDNQAWISPESKSSRTRPIVGIQPRRLFSDDSSGDHNQIPHSISRSHSHDVQSRPTVSIRDNGNNEFEFDEIDRMYEHDDPFSADPAGTKKKRELLDALDLPYGYTPTDTISYGQQAQGEGIDRPRTDPRDLIPEWKSPKPSIALLFSVCNRRDLVINLVPAILLAMASAAPPPLMTVLIGDAFGAFAAYPLMPGQATAEQKSKLMSEIGRYCWLLALAGAGVWLLNAVMLGFWVRTGELVVHRLRRKVYDSIMAKEMGWFDVGMGLQDVDKKSTSEGGAPSGDAIGAGGLMAKFTKESDDVRIACGVNFGSTIQAIVTFLACIVLALIKSWELTLVILSAIPVVLVISIFIEIPVGKQVRAERKAVAQASTTIERNTSTMATVKAFNAQKIETEKLESKLETIRKTQRMEAFLWGFTLSTTSFCMMIMFVAGFWYGAKLVGKGKVTPAAVMTVFWATILGSGNLQKVVPHLVLLTSGKIGMASLLAISMSPAPVKPSTRPTSSLGHQHRAQHGHKRSWSDETIENTQQVTISQRSKSEEKTMELRKIRPNKAIGEIDMRHVSFAYPSRPDALALDDVSLFLPAGETTFIVGGSGSGKSTVAQLLLRLYDPDQGQVMFDDQDIRYLDSQFLRENISAVQQGCVLFDMSVHDNIAMGLAGSPNRKPTDATREEVIQACQMAMIHEFIMGLPEQYDTMLGTKAANLSGGQRQRLAIARARLRDPTVLVLDEATSALDATSRIQVFEAVKRWRKNRMTICITHDLSQIQPEDFIYVMKDGRMTEQGFHADLLRKDGSEFGRMATMQAHTPLPLQDKVQWNAADDAEEILDFLDACGDSEAITEIARNRNSIMSTSRPISTSYLAYLNYATDPDKRTLMDSPGARMSKRNSYFGDEVVNVLATPPRVIDRADSHLSVRSIPGLVGSPERPRPTTMISRRSLITIHGNRKSRVIIPDADQFSISEHGDIEPPVNSASLIYLYRTYLSAVPGKYLMVIGMIFALGQGALTPVWSKYIAVLMAEVSTHANGTSTTTSVQVICITLANSITTGATFLFLEIAAANWAKRLRTVVFESILIQDQGWFDRPENSPNWLVQRIMKDVEDMKVLVGTILSRIATITVMIGLGIIWAMVVDWHLTLVGLGIGPIFAIASVIQTKVSAHYEARNKVAREQVAKTFYEGIANVRSIRALAFEETFKSNFESELTLARTTGNISAWVTGIGSGASMSIVYFGQALMIYVGAALIKLDVITYVTMLQVYSLVLFSVTFAAGLLDFIPAVAKAQIAGRDYLRLYQLSRDTSEQHGDLRFPISGQVNFDHVHFAYPTRSAVPVLKDLNIAIEAGECVCFVGPSGSGKSTISALLQRLYEPQYGSIRLGSHKLAQADVKWVRNHIAVVSQSAQLFDASVSDNIAYGTDATPQSEIERAARAANIHDFIMTLPHGYDTHLGENATLISGGQAQRLQMARALLRRASILILDECTSALDADNQKAILDTIMKIKETRTTIFITHKADIMRRCDRVFCLEDGRIAEQGTYDELIGKGGVFTNLMTSGEVE